MSNSRKTPEVFQMQPLYFSWHNFQEHQLPDGWKLSEEMIKALREGKQKEYDRLCSRLVAINEDNRFCELIFL